MSMVATGLSELVMKLVGHPDMAVSGGMAGSLHAWLGQELEVRGIDAVIYTRYILSILQQDAFVGDDLDLAADDHFFPSTSRRDGLHARRKPEKRRPVDNADCDQRKKTAAIKCLLSLSDEECGIESLVDELYLKLKEQQANITGIDGSGSGTSQSDTTSSSDSDSSESVADPAQRYYEAFPALGAIENPEPSNTAAPLTQEGGLWAAKVTQGLARIDGAVDVARRTDAARRASVSPRVIGAYKEDEKHMDNQYRRSCEWHGERGRIIQKNSRSNNCDGFRRKNLQQVAVKKAEKSQRFSNKFTLDKANDEMQMNLKKYGKLSLKKPSKAWKDYEYMRPIFIVPKMHSPDAGPSRVRSVRTNQKTESVLDFFFKSRAALASPLLDQICYCGAESIWGCTAGCVNWPEMLGLSADSEDQSWYTEPLDMMIKPSPLPSQRLYNRRTMLSSLSNIAFFENHLHAFSEALAIDDGNGMDLLGLGTLLTRTLEDSRDAEISSESDSFNTAEESFSELFLEVDDPQVEENCDIFTVTSNNKINDSRESVDSLHIHENEDELVITKVEECEEVAYPSHFKPNISHSPDQSNRSSPQYGICKGEIPYSEWSVTEKQECLSVLEALSTDDSAIPETPPSQASTVEALWDLQPVPNTGSNLIVDSVGKVNGAGTIWGYEALSTTFSLQNKAHLKVSSDTKWGCNGSFGTSKSGSHASSEDNLYEEDEGEHGLINDHCLCGESVVQSCTFGLGSAVWETSPLSQCSKQGHIPTPVSTENDVLDDRPLFYLPLADEDYKILMVNEPDSPLPLPPLEFNFSDSDENEDDYSPSTPISCHPVNHCQSYSLLSEPKASLSSSSSESFIEHSHPHSCISSREHVRGSESQAEDNGESTSASSGQLSLDRSTFGVMASLTCDTLSSSCSSFAMSPQASLPDVFLTTSLPLFPGTSSIWSYCLESLLSPGSDHSLFVSPISEEWPNSELLSTLPLSPKHEGSDLSHIWDINAVHRCNICEWGSDKLAAGVETQNIQHYLMNVGMDVTGRDSSCTLIDNNLCGSIISIVPLSIEGEETSSWSIWSDDDFLPLHDALTTPTLYEGALEYPPTNLNANESGAQLWQNFETRPQFTRQRSTSADHMDSNDTAFSQTVLSGSNELLPSENSAFCDRIPSRVGHLPHVQSEPALDSQRAPHKRIYNHGRLVQVQSRYKSDISILHHLGLTCTRNEDTQAEVEVLPHTHFLPIPSDTKRLTTSTKPVAPKPKIDDVNKVERIPTPTGPVPEVCPVLGRESSYQRYHHPDREEIEELLAFVPRFQVQKATEKCVQVGGGRSVTPAPTLEDVKEEEEDDMEKDAMEDGEELLVELDEMTSDRGSPSDTLLNINSQLALNAPNVAIELAEEDEVKLKQDPPVQLGGQQEALGMFLYDMHDVLELSVEDAERLMSSVPDNSPQLNEPDEKDEDCSSDYESMAAEQVSMEDLGRAGIAELWDGDDVEHNYHGCTSSPNERAIVPPAVPGTSNSMGIPSVPNAVTYRSIWSCDNYFPSLPDASGSTSHQDMDDPNFTCIRPVVWSQGDLELTLPDVEDVDLSGNLPNMSHWDANSDDVFIDDPEVQLQLCGVDPNPEPEKVIFSSDLEHHWFNSNSSFTVQVPNPGQYKMSGQRKPCSFFLEGNCRRTDCKFSHDISSITCRFWEEGNCFKGLTCPFLHGYTGDSESSDSQRSSIERDFSIEKDDFPELSAQQDNSGMMKGSGQASRSRGGNKREDRARSISTSEADRPHRKYRQNLNVTPSKNMKHVAGKLVAKDVADNKKTQPVLYTDV